MNIKNKKWESDFSPIDVDSTAPTSRFYTKAYLRHLIHCQELLAAQIATIHNLSFFIWLVTEARRRIVAGDFYAWKTKMVQSLGVRL
jgi:queuine tRNA-ribosyltransferase